jgi:hypothetical protein
MWAGEKTNAYIVLMGKHEGKHQLKVPGVDGRKILNRR